MMMVMMRRRQKRRRGRSQGRGGGEGEKMEETVPCFFMLLGYSGAFLLALPSDPNLFQILTWLVPFFTEI